MAYQIEYAYTSHMGKLRGNNEDNFWCCAEMMKADNQGTEGVLSGKIPQSQNPLFAVFDGMGGESCGETAAFLAAESCGKYYQENVRKLNEEPEAFLDEICRIMNREVCSYSAENRIRSMGTTAVMLAVGENTLYSCNLGDSRLYQLDQDGEFIQVSMDHVLKGGPYGKAPLIQYVGIPEEHMELEPYISCLQCRPGMRYLLCSDGMTDMLTDEEIREILSQGGSVQETVEQLLDCALKKGGRDNITIILCEIKEAEWKKRFLHWLDEKRKAFGGQHDEESDAGSGF